MKKYTVVIILLILSLPAFTQSVIIKRSLPGRVNITKSISGPSGTIAVIAGRSVSGTVNIVNDVTAKVNDVTTKDVTAKLPRFQADNPQFVDEDGNNYINANENASVILTLKNTGEGPAVNIQAKLYDKNRVSGLEFPLATIGTLQPSQSKNIELQLKGLNTTTNSTASLGISISEGNGIAAEIPLLSVQVKAFLAPLIKITDVDYGTGPIRKGEKFNVSVTIQNVGLGVADDVTLLLDFPNDNVFILEGDKSINFPKLTPGESKIAQYTLISKPNYQLSKIVLPFILKERFDKYADNTNSLKQILLEQQLTSNKNVAAQGVQENVPVDEPKAAVAAPSFTSDVDNITPANSLKNQKRIALIIGNENYSQYFNAESNVDYAKNDATTFKKYAINVFGVEEDNVFDVYDATSSIMRTKIDQVALLLKKMGPTSELIFYYAGHGFPDEVSKIPYLIPVDVSGTNLTSAIKLADIYAKFGSSGASKMVVFLDACFSGGGRSQPVLPARGVRMEPNTEDANPSGNMIVFSASKGQQSALAFEKEKHGLFTYYLLKKLKEPGTLTYEQLFNYIYDKVSIDAVKQNSKEQDPDIIISPDLGEKWKTWKVK